VPPLFWLLMCEDFGWRHSFVSRCTPAAAAPVAAGPAAGACTVADSRLCVWCVRRFGRKGSSRQLTWCGCSCEFEVSCCASLLLGPLCSSCLGPCWAAVADGFVKECVLYSPAAQHVQFYSCLAFVMPSWTAVEAVRMLNSGVCSTRRQG
jgi:hypothetical protein